MRKPVFLQRESLTRLGVAFLLTSGIALPLLLAFELERYVLSSLFIALGLLLFLTVLTTSRKTFVILWVLLGAAAAIQFFLPNTGLFGDWLEAFKAMALYFSGYTVALPLFGAQVASFMVVMITTLSFIFAKRGVGFLPAALIVVVALFGLWSLGKGSLFWYVAPALVALLLQMSQEAHEKINILHVIPMALAAVLLAFLLTPASRVTVLPLESAATKLKQTISDYLFFTEPRDVFTLGSYGYYPIGNNQLGGAAEPSEFPVMTVKTDRKTLLRAVAKDYYDGRSFSDTSNAKRYLYINPRWQAQRRKAFLELLPGEAIRKISTLMDAKAVSVQMQNAAASTVFTPLFLRSLNTTNDMVPYFNESSELFITRDLVSGDRYTVYTPIFEGGDAGLEALVNAPQKDDAYYQDFYDQYTQLPGHMEQKVFDDVQNIVQNESTAYGKAMAIMRHLQKYYRYTLTPAEPPQNLDFVTYFLYVGKEGYCTYYASAMTVMCRMAGLPARYVEGFLAQPAADGLAYVTGKEAHAWTEVYFEGFGWVPFDPTPPQTSSTDTPEQNQNQNQPEVTPTPSPTPTPPGEQDAPTPTPNPGQSPEPSTPKPSDPPQDQTDNNPDTNPDDKNPNPFPWLWLLAAAALAALGTRIALRTPERVAKRQTSERDRIFIYAAAVRQLLIFAKRAPKNGETPLAFAHRIDGVHAFPTPIMPLWRLLVLSHYSHLELEPEQTRSAREVFHKGYQGSSVFRRVRFLFAAAFNSRFYHVLETPTLHDRPPQKLAFRPPKASVQAAKQAHTTLRRPPEKQATHTPAQSAMPDRDAAPAKDVAPAKDAAPSGPNVAPTPGRKRRAP
ncbi:MAG: hypothetical protein LLF96_12675 [Eubacteriales bacterium]|nr:hypothetical protein [Eubacteriales bacterium]